MNGFQNANLPAILVALTVVVGTSAANDAAAQVTMTTGNGKTMTLTLQTLPDSPYSRRGSSCGVAR